MGFPQKPLEFLPEICSPENIKKLHLPLHGILSVFLKIFPKAREIADTS